MLAATYTVLVVISEHHACAGLQDKRQTAKAEKLDKIRKGEKAVDDKHRTDELKQASKDFYKQVRSWELRKRCQDTAGIFSKHHSTNCKGISGICHGVSSLLVGSWT